MLSETKKKLLYFFIKKNFEGNFFEIKKEFSFEFDFEISEIFFDFEKKIIFLKEKNEKISTILSSIFEIEKNPFENLNIFFSSQKNEEIIDLIFTQNYSILITPKNIFFYKKKNNEIISKFSNFQNNEFFQEFFIFGDLLFGIKKNIIKIFSPIKNYSNQILSINKKNSQIGIILFDRIFLFSENLENSKKSKKSKNQEIYCHSIKGNISEILLLNIGNFLNFQKIKKNEKTKKKFLTISSKILDFSQNLIFSNKFVLNFLENEFSNLLPYYFLKGNLSNLSLSTKQKIAIIYKLDTLNPKIIFSKEINKKSLNLIQEVIQNDFYGVYKNVNKFDSLLYLLYSNNYKLFYDTLKDFVFLKILKNENFEKIVSEALNERLGYIFKKDLKFEKNLKEKTENFEILKKDEDILNNLKILIKNEKSEKLKFGEMKYIINLKIGKTITSLNPAKSETLEEFLGEKIQKKSEKKNLDLEEEEIDLFSEMILYLNFTEISEKKFLNNKINSEKILLKNENFSYILLENENPLDFEDIWGLKIEKIFSLKLENLNFIELEKNWGNDNFSEFIDFEFWFKTYENKEIIFFSTNKAKIFFGYKNKKFFFQNGKNLIFFENSKNEILIENLKWNHISLIFTDKKITIFFNNKKFSEKILKKKIKNFTKSKSYLFPFFKGEITEIRIWKILRENEIRDKYYKQPLPQIFSEANNVKIKIARGKKRKTGDLKTLVGLSNIFLNLKKKSKSIKKNLNKNVIKSQSEFFGKNKNFGISENFDFEKNVVNRRNSLNIEKFAENCKDRNKSLINITKNNTEIKLFANYYKMKNHSFLKNRGIIYKNFLDQNLKAKTINKLLKICRENYLTDNFSESLKLVSKSILFFIKNKNYIKKVNLVLNGLIHYKFLFSLLIKLKDFKKKKIKKKIICFIWIIILTLKLKIEDRIIFLIFCIIENYEAKNYALIPSLLGAIEKNDIYKQFLKNEIFLKIFEIKNEIKKKKNFKKNYFNIKTLKCPYCYKNIIFTGIKKCRDCECNFEFYYKDLTLFKVEDCKKCGLCDMVNLKIEKDCQFCKNSF